MKAFVLISLIWLSHFVLAAPTPTSEDRPKVLLQEIKPLEDKRRVIVPVKVEAKIQSLMTADIEGHVTKILKPLGSVVKSGEIILFLENKDPGFTYAAVPVRAPIAGVVSHFWTTQMAKVSRGEKLFTVINPKSLKLTAEFPSGDLNIVRAGLTGEFKCEAQKDSKLTVRILGISPLVDARTGTAAAEFEFTNSKELPPPIGSVGQATFEISQGSIFMIPESSLVFQDGKPMVRVIKADNKVDKRPIELGEQRDSSFVVKSGIAAGDRVVVRASRALKENDIIEVEKSEEKTR
ncbi:MAG: efflux RND transporter periplasmic adaptor subunit [Pseudobdellovibrionaceae bacterium]